jgi:hypothetical protein
MKILSLGGAGAVCQHATRDLARFSHFDEIAIGETNACGFSRWTPATTSD